MLHLILSFAQYEREINSERVRDKLAQKAARGQWTGGWVPYGYDYDGRKKLLIPNNDEATAVNLMFEMFAETKSQKAVATHINALGYRTKSRVRKGGTDKGKEKGSLRFSTTRITEILNNPIYLGMIRFKDKDYEGEHESLLNNRSLWFRAADILKDKQKKSQIRPQQDRYTFLLKGLVYCGVCKSCMSSDFSGKKDKEGQPYLYYTCTAVKRLDRTACTRRSIPARPFEEIILSVTKAFGENKALLETTVQKATQQQRKKIGPLEKKKDTLERRLQELNTTIKNTVQILTRKGMAAVTDELETEMENLQKDKHSMTDELNRIKFEIKQLKKSELNLNNVETAFAHINKEIEKLELENQKALLQLIIKRITVKPFDPEKQRDKLDGMLPKGTIITKIRTKWYVVKIEFYELPDISLTYDAMKGSSYQKMDGSSGRARTADPVINSHLLYRLSY